MARVPESQWIDRFLRRLSSLQPSLEIAHSMRYAMEVYGEDPDVEPEFVAETYTCEISPTRHSMPPATGAGTARGADASG